MVAGLRELKANRQDNDSHLDTLLLASNIKQSLTVSVDATSHA
jgi:hypothetical protein